MTRKRSTEALAQICSPRTTPYSLLTMLTSFVNRWQTSDLTELSSFWH